MVASWYSENNRDVPLEVLDGETEFSFMEGEAVKFDCFPTLCTTFTAPVLQQPVERSPLLVPPPSCTKGRNGARILGWSEEPPGPTMGEPDEREHRRPESTARRR